MELFTMIMHLEDRSRGEGKKEKKKERVKKIKTRLF